jgi:hypothetical protein
LTRRIKRTTFKNEGEHSMKNLYFISFLFLIGCGSGAEGSSTCYDCGESTGGMGGESTGGTNSETGGDTSTGGALTGGASGSTGGVATGGSNTCTPTVSCSDGQTGSACGQIDDGCGNLIDCGCSAYFTCGGKNSERMAYAVAITPDAFTEPAVENICSNGCTKQPMLAAINAYCGENNNKTLWTCPNGSVTEIPEEIKNNNCTNSNLNIGFGAYCCDQ